MCRHCSVLNQRLRILQALSEIPILLPRRISGVSGTLCCSALPFIMLYCTAALQHWSSAVLCLVQGPVRLHGHRGQIGASVSIFLKLSRAWRAAAAACGQNSWSMLEHGAVACCSNLRDSRCLSMMGHLNSVRSRRK